MKPTPPPAVRVMPANEVAWEDLQAIFDISKNSRGCHCQWFKYADRDWRQIPHEERAMLQRDESGCEDPGATRTTGLVAYVDGEPAAWVALEPRVAYRRLLSKPTVWSGRHEDKADDGVWAVTCFVVRKPFRGMHLTYVLAEAALGYAREQGAEALEAYPMVHSPEVTITWDELYVGPLNAFLAAGYEVVSAPSKRRRVVRVDF